MKYIFMSSFLLLGYGLFSQSIERSVLSSVGGLHANADYQIEYTVGEPIIGEASNNNLVLYQGFQQVFETLTSILEVPEEGTVVLFPNPNTGNFSLQSDFEIENLKIFDVNGRLVQEKLNAEDNNVQSDLPPGKYFLHINTATAKAFSLPFIVQ
jgi:hypothetical protein